MESMRDYEDKNEIKKKLRAKEMDITEPDADVGGNLAICVPYILDDMDSETYMELGIQRDGDVFIKMVDFEYDPMRRVDMEFCTPISGGGRYPIIHVMIKRLVKLLKEANDRNMMSRDGQMKLLKEKGIKGYIE